MSTKTVCDFCEEPIVGKAKVTAEELDGRILDFCSTTCLIDFINNAEDQK